MRHKFYRHTGRETYRIAHPDGRCRKSSNLLKGMYRLLRNFLVHPAADPWLVMGAGSSVSVKTRHEKGAPCRNYGILLDLRLISVHC